MPNQPPAPAPVEIKACPFCGCIPSLLKDGGLVGYQCDGCITSPSTSFYEDRESALAEWNTRPAEQALRDVARQAWKRGCDYGAGLPPKSSAYRYFEVRKTNKVMEADLNSILGGKK